MPLCRRQVDQPSFSQEINFSSILQAVLFDKISYFSLFLGHLRQGWDVDLDIKMARIGNNSSIFHPREMISVYDIPISCGCDKYIADLSCLC